MSHCVRNPAEYNRLITVERLKANVSPDAGGHVQETVDANWEEYTPAYAKVTTKGGREFWKVNRVEDTVDSVFRFPYSTTLEAATTEMRIDFREKKYNIVAVINVDLADQEIEIQAKS